METPAAQHITNNLKKRFGVPSGLVMALTGVFVLWGGTAQAAFTFDALSTGFEKEEISAFTKSDPIEPDQDPEEPVDPSKHKVYRVDVLIPKENGEWQTSSATFLEDTVSTQFDINISDAILEQSKSDFLYLVFGADTEFEWDDQSNTYIATANLFSVGENPTDLIFNEENFPDRDEIGFRGSAGNFTVEDGKTLVLFGEAPLNESYLGEGKTGTVFDGTLVFGLPYKFSEFNDGLSSGNTGALILGDGANVVFQNGTYTLTGFETDNNASVLFRVEDGADVNFAQFPGSGKNEQREIKIVSNGKVEMIGTGGAIASSGGDSQVIVDGSGETIIKGRDSGGEDGLSAIATGSGSLGSLIFQGTGRLIIQGGSNETAYGLEYVGVSNWGPGSSTVGKGTISNIGSGKLDLNGIQYISGQRGNGTISNEGSGILSILGGNDGNVFHGIYLGSFGGTTSSTNEILNTGNGTLNICAGNGGDGTDGIHRFGGVGSLNSVIRNAEHGAMNILGNSEKKSYGIRYLNAGASNVSLENAGTLSLDAYAIMSFGSYATVTNKSTGKVYAEAEAIFERTESASSADSQIGLLSPSDGAESDAKVEGFGSSGTTIAWDLKDDWAEQSVWEDGGVLNVTDVVEGSLAAQQIETAFTSLFGTGTTLNFLGEDDWASEGASSSADAFTASVGNTLIDQGYAGNIVTNFNLNNAASDGSAQTLTIGIGEGQVIKDSLGFRQVEGVSSLTVNSGKYFALIGLPAGGELIKGGAPVTLDNGTLMLGVTPAQSAREDSSTSGTLETVEMKNGSNIDVENMWVRIDSVKGNGDVTLTETGRLYVKELNVEGDVDNDGTLSADSVTVSGGTLTTTKTLKSEGKISVSETGTLSADGILASDTLDVKGVLKLGQSISVYTGKQALKLMRERHEDVAAELDRLEGKTEVSTMSVLDRIVAQSMKKNENTDASQEESGKGDEGASPSASTGAAPSVRRTAPILPQDAQAFAAFDAVNRVVSNIEDGASTDGHGLWIKLLTGESEFGVRSGSQFEVDSDGAVIGAEARLHANWKVGAALSYLDGEIDSGALKSDWKSYGLTAYAHYRAGDFGLKGSAGWLRGTTEASKDYDADVWHAGIRSEYGFTTGPVTVTPFFGGRLMSGSFDGMSSQTVVSVPVGLKIAGELSTNGWTLRPVLEAFYARSIGDTEAEDVRFLPKDAFTGSFSVRFEKDAWSGELGFRGAVGSNDYENRSFTAKIGLKF